MQRPSNLIAARFQVRGTVQGVGFRPFVRRLASALGIAGWVRNDREGVTILAEGPPETLRDFRRSLLSEAPRAAHVEGVVSESIAPTGLGSFRIRGSESGGQLRARVPRDLATCEACRRESDNPLDHRFGYPFTNCVECGPRYSILEALPYDRSATTMRRFPLCGRCSKEYRQPSDRRYHAEPIACPDCGPGVVLWDSAGREIGRAATALDGASAALRAGQIVALKGLGGFQLLVRADHSDPVARLRLRKGRPTKPFAVMTPSLDEANRLGCPGPEEALALASPANPIVLVEARADQGLAPEVAPGTRTIGLLLPTTMLHHLLLARLDFPVIATSGNRGDQPIVIDENEFVSALKNIADVFLVHDRPIARRVDDGVTRGIAGRLATFRLARGQAPMTLVRLEERFSGVPPLLAVGGHQKSAIALWTGHQAILSQHIGDLDGLATREAFEQVVGDLTRLYGVESPGLACDEHPDYFTTRWAESRDRPLFRVQHHHAHAAAAMVEHGLLDQEVLALTWDGTGHGPDGTIWGGEVLRASLAGFARVASLLPFPLPGGEAAIRQPRRSALGVLAMTLGDDAILTNGELLARLGLAASEASTILKMVRRRVGVAWTSSVGRLFDVAAAIVLALGEVSHEAEAATRLEAIADPRVTEGYLMGRLRPEGSLERGDWRPLIAGLLADIAAGVDNGVIAARFHNALALWAAEVLADQPPIDVVLGGGCFQNRFLTEAVVRELGSRNRVFGPGTIPTGDGGLAAGQLAVALARSARGRPKGGRN